MFPECMHRICYFVGASIFSTVFGHDFASAAQSVHQLRMAQPTDPNIRLPTKEEEKFAQYKSELGLRVEEQSRIPVYSQKV